MPESYELSRRERQIMDAVFALGELPENTRRVFVLRRYEGMRHEEIAKHLGMSVSGVRFHMEKAKAYLAWRLEKAK